MISTGYYPGKVISNLYQGSISYPFDEIRSLRLNIGLRKDNVILSGVDQSSLFTGESVKNLWTYASGICV